MTKVELGKKVRDTLSGIEGIATARTEFLYGCARILVETSERKDGKPVEIWVDEQRLLSTSQAKTGGPGPSSPSRDHQR